MLQHDFVNLSADELKSYMSDHAEQDYTLVDVRQPKEYVSGHIPGAVLIPLKELEQRVFELEEKKDIIVYCRSGKRSRVAATFIIASGISFDSLYNLDKGILGWNGKKLEDMPAVSLFEDLEDLDTTLTRAMDFEKGAEKFYSICAERHYSSAFAPFAGTLAKLEEGHARFVYSILKDMNPGIPAFHEMYAAMEGDILEGGISIEDALSHLAAIPDERCLNFMEMALDIEYRAYDLYRNLAMHAEALDVKDVLYKLSSQEKSHIRIVAGGMDLCVEE